MQKKYIWILVSLLTLNLPLFAADGVTKSANDPYVMKIYPDGTKVIADFSAFNDSQTLLFIGTVSGAAGVFTIANVPAVFQLNPPVAAPGPTLLGTSSATPSISLYLQSEAVTTGINSVAINDTTRNTGDVITVELARNVQDFFSFGIYECDSSCHFEFLCFVLCRVPPCTLSI